ncbi:OPT oligopeptide transporter protein-domain-containing protein [Sporodiniella umbellata]|nr:OPT oligopeptide transporter protein-domain-containing protein [Sporodiniella umbellata]
MYFGLQTGWISMMSLQSSLLGFAIFKPFQPMLRHKFGAIENVILQTTAVATATMPLAAGFVGVIPAMELMTSSDNPDGPVVLTASQLILWSLAVAFFGVFFAIPLRKQTIIREKLKFPSGTATAQMISLLHEKPDPTVESPNLRRRVGASAAQEQTRLLGSDDFERVWSLKLRGMLVSFSVSSVYTVLTYFFPSINTLPIFNWLTFNLIDFRAWEWYFTPSFSYIGQGIIMGLPTTLSMLLGCVIGWGILSPLAYYTGWAPGPVDDWKTGSKGWILWISLGVMIAESCVSLLVVLARTLVQSYHQRASQYRLVGEQAAEDAPSNQQVSVVVTVLGLILSSVSCIYIIDWVFGSDTIPKKMTFLAIFIAMFLSILGVRALGETDLNPVSGIGKISQVLFAGFMPGSILANLIAGGIAEAGAQQAGDLMQDLKTGHLLGASPKAQFYGQMIGSLASVFIASGAYMLYRAVYSIPGPQFPVPTAQVWLDMSRLVNGHPLPAHVTEFVYAFALLFAVFVLVKELYPSKTRFIPQGIAFAIGMYNPPNFTLARVMGGLIVYFWNKACEEPNKGPAWIEPYRSVAGKVFIVILASGLVLGEGTFSIVTMAMRAFGVPHL